MCPATDFPRDNHEFIEVTAANLAAVLETGLPQAPNVAGDAFPLPVAAYTKSPLDRRAAALEQVLLHCQHGTGEEGSRLMSRLEAVPQRYVDGLRAWVDAQIAQIEDAMTRMAKGALAERQSPEVAGQALAGISRSSRQHSQRTQRPRQRKRA